MEEQLLTNVEKMFFKAVFELLNCKLNSGMPFHSSAAVTWNGWAPYDFETGWKWQEGTLRKCTSCYSEIIICYSTFYKISRASVISVFFCVYQLCSITHHSHSFHSLRVVTMWWSQSDLSVLTKQIPSLWRQWTLLVINQKSYHHKTFLDYE